MRALLQKGANVNAAEGDGTTALHWAAYRDDLASGRSADPRRRARQRRQRSRRDAALGGGLNGNAAIVRRLLQAGANPNAALMLGETPVMTAARTGTADVVEQLLANGADRQRARRRAGRRR